ncbi:hypothetical protein [Herbaspirillum aquaticum]|uniref:DNA-directed DNA polymerase family A palm domain-containing protein n=1 Tax=Herbaspirillum aquaticum TaxID=568783 RepID=A0A225SR87_9BURK|nr:hypothetical protein [Herbaspirillum aquaticum]OWY31669.1 hypothetical protein CEJ45_24340 [Herbaspirillum aquaticum]
MARAPSLKLYQAQKCIDKYVDAMLSEIAYSVVNFGFADDQLSLPITQMRENVGRIRIDGKNEWTVEFLHKNRNTSLVLIDFRGNVGKNSRVSLNPLYQNEIWSELIYLAPAPMPKLICETYAEANVHLKANLASLESFIKKTRITFERADGVSEKYCQKLLRNLLTARRLRDLAFEDEGSFYLPEHWTETDSGRMYGRALSLQRISQEVRNAALGRCHKYDFKASSYGLMTGLAKNINPELKIATIGEYIRKRSDIRKKIASDIEISDEWMKDIFTSLGFGASTADNPYTSIRGKLGKEKYDVLMANRQFRHIYECMDAVRKTIAASFPDDFEFLGRKYDAIDPNSEFHKKRTANQKLAWIYQVMESHAITHFGERAMEHGYEPILFAHDCVYFSQKLPQALLEDIMYELNQMFPLKWTHPSRQRLPEFKLHP